MEHEPESIETVGAAHTKPAPSLRAGVARPRPAPRRRPGRARALIAGLAAGTAAAGGAVLANGWAAGADSPVRAPSATLSAAEIDTMLMPITAADARAALRLGEFEAAAARNAANECEGKAPESGPIESLPADARLHLFEDPAVLRVSGLGITSNVRSTPLSGPTGAPPSLECANAARAAIAPIDSLVGDIRNTWLRAVQTTESSPAVQSAWSEWSKCMHAAGYALENEDAFHRLVDGRMSTLIGAGDLEAARAEELTLARAFADCLGDVVNARAQARGEARAALIRARDADVAAARSGLGDAIREVGRKHAVTFG